MPKPASWFSSIPTSHFPAPQLAFGRLSLVVSGMLKNLRYTARALQICCSLAPPRTESILVLQALRDQVL